MSQELVTVTLDLADQLEEEIQKQASYEQEIESLKNANQSLQQELDQLKSAQAMSKKASDGFNAAMLSATTSLEQVGFLTPGSAVKAYQALLDNPQEVPVLIEKLAGALNQNFNEGTLFMEKGASEVQNNESNPWLGLIQ
jgi:hypothetical protein